MSDVPSSPEREADVLLAENLQKAPKEWSGEWAAFVTAVQFLTQLPLVPHRAVSEKTLSRCPIYFPLVGGIIGAVTSIIVWAGCCVWPVWLAVIAALAVEARLTGAFHEDAVADFCDAFGGGWTREDVQRILKDSRIGSFGTVGLGMALALRAGAMIEIVQRFGREHWMIWSAAIVAGASISRLIIIGVMIRIPPVQSREGLSSDIGRQLNYRDLLTAAFWMIPAILPFAIELPMRLALSVAVLVPTVIWFTRLVRRRIGGVTGDCLGFICYVSNVTILLVTAARWQS